MLRSNKFWMWRIRKQRWRPSGKWNDTGRQSSDIFICCGTETRCKDVSVKHHREREVHFLSVIFLWLIRSNRLCAHQKALKQQRNNSCLKQNYHIKVDINCRELSLYPWQFATGNFQMSKKQQFSDKWEYFHSEGQPDVEALSVEARANRVGQRTS